jgi:urease accessory protein
MIKKIVSVVREGEAQDSVLLSWFDLRKPKLSAVSAKGVNFTLKIAADRIENGDRLIAEDGYTIAVEIAKDETIVFEFKNAADFAKTAYEIGNRHQPIVIEDMKIVALNNGAIADIIQTASANADITVSKSMEFFRPYANSSHVH